MPIYEYHCEACGQDFEKLMRLSDLENAPECPVCQSRETHRQISRIAWNSPAGGVSLTSTSGSSSCNSRGRFT